MKKTLLPVMFASALLSVCPAFGQSTPSNTRTAQGSAATDTDATYGRVKEMTAGQKVVIDVDNAPDKSYDLTDKDTTVTVTRNLKVGDAVKVMETDRNGKKMVQIMKDTEGGVKHGDKSATEETR
jgi:hypothetical protein